jgi:hypothetical protein
MASAFVTYVMWNVFEILDISKHEAEKPPDGSLQNRVSPCESAVVMVKFCPQIVHYILKFGSLIQSLIIFFAVVIISTK